METLEQPESASSGTKPGAEILLENDWREWRSPAGISIAAHAIVVTALLLIPASHSVPLPDDELAVHVTPVFEATDLTQTAPNKGPISKEVSVESIAPHPLVKTPAPAPAATRAPAPAPVPAPPAAPPAVALAPPKPILIDPPKIQPDVKATALPDIAQALPAPPTQTPRPSLQDVNPAPKPAQGRSGAALSLPDSSVEEAIRTLSRTAPQGSQSVGDLGADEGGSGPGLNLPPSAGRPASSLELRSDPMGVDFRPYMLQVLASVRRNWFAVYPEAARQGQRGQVTIEFAISKEGKVIKVVFTGQSGARPLDQAAVAAISASNPLIPLPAAFQGDRIVLAMTFLYNMPRR